MNVMGGFLTLSGISNADFGSVEAALQEALRRNGASFEISETANPEEQITVFRSPTGSVTIQFPPLFADGNVSSQLSRILNTPVFSLHIHDDDLWMYLLYEKGTDIDRYNPQPHYFVFNPEESERSWKGNPRLIAEKWSGASETALKRYLLWCHFSWWFMIFRLVLPGWLRPYDPYWQLAGFMKRVGLVFPMQPTPGIEIRHYRCPMPKPEPVSLDDIQPGFQQPISLPGGGMIQLFFHPLLLKWVRKKNKANAEQEEEMKSYPELQKALNLGDVPEVLQICELINNKPEFTIRVLLQLYNQVEKRQKTQIARSLHQYAGLAPRMMIEDSQLLSALSILPDDEIIRLSRQS